MNKKAFIHTLFEIGAVKFGSFTLKNKMATPIYIDLRRAISVPKFLSAMASMFSVSAELLCGIPYAALPLATALSLKHNVPMLLLRKETKGHGTKQLIEGIYTKGQTCFVVEDVIVSGESILDAIELLQSADIVVQDIGIVVDRQQGGVKRLHDLGYKVHVLCTLTEIVEELVCEKKITKEKGHEVITFIQSHSVYP